MAFPVCHRHCKSTMEDITLYGHPSAFIHSYCIYGRRRQQHQQHQFDLHTMGGLTTKTTRLHVWAKCGHKLDVWNDTFCSRKMCGDVFVRYVPFVLCFGNRFVLANKCRNYARMSKKQTISIEKSIIYPNDFMCSSIRFQLRHQWRRVEGHECHHNKSVSSNLILCSRSLLAGEGLSTHFDQAPAYFFTPFECDEMRLWDNNGAKLGFLCKLHQKFLWNLFNLVEICYLNAWIRYE